MVGLIFQPCVENVSVYSVAFFIAGATFQLSLKHSPINYVYYPSLATVSCLNRIELVDFGTPVVFGYDGGIGE